MAISTHSSIIADLIFFFVKLKCIKNFSNCTAALRSASIINGSHNETRKGILSAMQSKIVSHIAIVCASLAARPRLFDLIIERWRGWISHRDMKAEAKFNLSAERFRNSSRSAKFRIFHENFGNAPRPDLRAAVFLLTEWNQSELRDLHRHAGNCLGRILIERIFLSR